MSMQRPTARLIVVLVLLAVAFVALVLLADPAPIAPAPAVGMSDVVQVAYIVASVQILTLAVGVYSARKVAKVAVAVNGQTSLLIKATGAEKFAEGERQGRAEEVVKGEEKAAAVAQAQIEGMERTMRRPVSPDTGGKS